MSDELHAAEEVATAPYYEHAGVSIYHGDCLDVLPRISPVVIDAVIADLPYGITKNKWDSVIPLGDLWRLLYRSSKPSAAFVFTASQPFTSTLVQSNIGDFRHEWIWLKNKGSNFANTVREPFKEHESVLVFSRGKWTFNKQLQPRSESGRKRSMYGVTWASKSNNYREFDERPGNRIMPELRVPSSHQAFGVERGLHPTQKPVALMAYMVATYTNPGDVVLDCSMGSGSTLVAAAGLGRRAIGIEIEERYCEVAADRLRKQSCSMFELDKSNTPQQ